MGRFKKKTIDQTKFRYIDSVLEYFVLFGVNVFKDIDTKKRDKKVFKNNTYNPICFGVSLKFYHRSEVS